MRRIFTAVLMVVALSGPAAAAPDATFPASAPSGCTDPAAGNAAGLQLAQRGCRSECSSSRGYCMSTCRDSLCRAICNDRYQSCLSSCR
jgi:hypothetical protein